jgi:hypothetical protein
VSSKRTKVLESKKDKAATPYGDVDIDACLSAGCFRPNSRREFKYFGRTRGVGVLNFFEGRRYDVVAGIQLLDTLRRGRDDDFVERAALARGGGLVGCVGAAGTVEDPDDGGGEGIQSGGA